MFMDKAELSWRRIKSSNTAPKLTRAFAVENNGNIIIFGGPVSEKRNEVSLLMYNVGQNNWTELEMKVEHPAKWTDDITTPLAFSGGLYNSELIVCGGVHARYSSTYLYSLDLSSWIKAAEDDSKMDIETDDILTKLYKDKSFSDIVFEVEGERISAHKSILAAGCRYFNNMFTSGMEESKTDVIKTTEIKAKTFKAVVEYIYRKNLRLNEDLAIELLEAEKFCLPKLKNKAEDFLTRQLTVHNFVKLSKAAELYEADILKQALCEFVKENKSSLIGREDLFDLPKSILIQIAFLN